MEKNTKMKVNNFYRPTPVRLRKIGDGLLLMSVGLGGMVMALPLPDNTQAWLVFSVNVLGLIGKVITNMFTDDTVKQ